MIIKENGAFEVNSLYPSSDWYNEKNYVIDETKEENQELIEKIKVHAPYMELVIEESRIVDVIPTERPEPIFEIVNEQVDEEKSFLAEAVIQLSGELEVLKQEIQTLKGGN